MRRLAFISVTVLLLMGLGEVGASAFFAGHVAKVHAPTKLVSQGSTPGSPGIKPGTGAKERADARALVEARKHRHEIIPRHKRHTPPSVSATPAPAPTP